MFAKIQLPDKQGLLRGVFMTAYGGGSLVGVKKGTGKEILAGNSSSYWTLNR
jgi:hypothetical protein